MSAPDDLDTELEGDEVDLELVRPNVLGAQPLEDDQHRERRERERERADDPVAQRRLESTRKISPADRRAALEA